MINPDRRGLLFGIAASGGVLAQKTLAATAPAALRLASLPKPWVDPAEGSRLKTPALLRGTVQAHIASGVTTGPGQTEATRSATLAGLQAAVDYAAANNKFFEVEPNTYEIFGPAGLVVPASAANFKWVGSVGAHFIQFCPDSPILTIGDTSNNGYAAHQTVTGFSLDYGVSQAGKAGAVALVLGSAAWTLVEQFIACTSYLINPPSVGLAVRTASSSNRFFFQNTIRNGHIGGGQVNLLSVRVDGTGNLWEDLYTHFGADAASRQTCSGAAWDLDPPGQMDDNVFVRCNIEHVNSSEMIRANGALDCTFIGLHVEDVGLMGTNPVVVSQVAGQLRFVESLIMDLALVAADGQAAIHRAAGYGERAAFDGLHFKWSSYAGGALSANTLIVAPPANRGNDTNPAVSIDSLTVQDDTGINATRLFLDSVFDQALVGGTFIARVQEDSLLPTTHHLQLPVTAAYCHYGMHEDAVLFVPAAITSFTISLSDHVKASGMGSTLPPKPGTRLRIRRQSGTARGVLTVSDAATATTLTTNTTGGMDLIYVFGATGWIAAA